MLPTCAPGRQALRALAALIDAGSRPCSLHSHPVHAQRRRIVCLASPREDLLRGVSADNRDAVARIVEQAERALESWTVVHSDFHSPPVVAEALAVLGRMSDTVAVAWGGYPQAERCRQVPLPCTAVPASLALAGDVLNLLSNLCRRVSVGREESLAGAAESPGELASVCAVVVKGNFLFDPATHRDFLGAALGTGIERSRLGDIVMLGESGAQLLVAPSLVEHLESALNQARRRLVLSGAIYAVHSQGLLLFHFYFNFYERQLTAHCPRPARRCGACR